MFLAALNRHPFVHFSIVEPNQKYIFSLIALNENNDTVIPEQFYDFQMPSEGKLNHRTNRHDRFVLSVSSHLIDDDRQPPKTPLELNLVPRSKTSVLLQWTDVDFSKTQHTPSSRRYKIQLNELDSNQQVSSSRKCSRATNNRTSSRISSR